MASTGIIHSALMASFVLLAGYASVMAQARQLTQGPGNYQCDRAAVANFYVAPGFGCFLDAPPCESQWLISDSSNVKAIQGPGGNSVTHIKCRWPAEAVAKLPEATRQQLGGAAIGDSASLRQARVGRTASKTCVNTTASVFYGTGKVSLLGNGDLTITCSVNPGSDKNLGPVDKYVAAIVGCLNGDSLVDTLGGPRKVKDISVGDKVLARSASGALVYDDVVFTPHQDSSSLAMYQDIKASIPDMQESRQLLVTLGHYVPVGKGFKMAKDVLVGDTISVVVGNTSTAAIVESSAPTTLRGYYGVWTMSGSIVVDGVLATAHAQWPVDSLLNMLPGDTVTKHHMLQAPVRMLYKIAGPAFTKSLSNIVQAAGAAHPVSVGGAVAAYALAGAKASEAPLQA